MSKPTPAALYQKLRPFLEATGNGDPRFIARYKFIPGHGYVPKEPGQPHIQDRRMIVWNPKAKRRPTYAEFLHAFRLEDDEA